jgi:putative inorganic carbon (HCO3(-)) transporter
VIVVEPLILLLMLPLVLFPDGERAAVVLLLPLLWLLRKVGKGYFVPLTAVNWSIFGLLLMVLVSLYATFDMAFSFPKVAGLIYGIAVFFAVVDWMGSERRFWLGVAGLAAAGGAIAAFALVGVRLSNKIPLLGPVVALLPQRNLVAPGRDVGVNPNEIAGALLWVLPLVGMLALTAVWRWADLRRQVGTVVALLLALALWGLSGLMSLVLLLTQSRSGLLGAAVAMLLLGVGILAARSRRWLAAGLVGLALLVVGVGWLVQTHQLEGLLFAQAGVDEDGTVASLDGRLELWSRAIYGLQDFPFTGMGMNNFRRVVPILYPLFLVAPNVDMPHAHNQLLQNGVDLGIPGLIAYLALYMGLAGMLWQAWRRAPTSWLRAAALGLGGCLLGFFVFGLTDAIALGARPGFLFWYLVGLTAVVHQRIIGATLSGSGSASESQPASPSPADSRLP